MSRSFDELKVLGGKGVDTVTGVDTLTVLNGVCRQHNFLYDMNLPYVLDKTNVKKLSFTLLKEFKYYRHPPF